MTLVDEAPSVQAVQLELGSVDVAFWLELLEEALSVQAFHDPLAPVLVLVLVVADTVLVIVLFLVVPSLPSDPSFQLFQPPVEAAF